GDPWPIRRHEGAVTGTAVNSTLADDRRYCRRALPLVSRTFAINIRVLAGSMAEWVLVGYLLCRTADTLEDAWPEGPTEARFLSFLAALDGDDAQAQALADEAAAIARGPELELVAHLPQVLRVLAAFPPAGRAALADGGRTPASGMAGYATRAAARGPFVPYLDTESELDDYCWVVAGCVGVMLTRLYAQAYGEPDAARQARRVELAPLVGRA